MDSEAEYEATPDDMSDETTQHEDTEQQAAYERLTMLYQSGNIAQVLFEEEGGKETLSRIGETAIRHFKLDEESRADWVEKNKDAMKLARQVADEKIYPWPNAANILYPLISEAAIQFNARSYPAIVNGKNIVKAKINGYDEDGTKQAQGDRIAKHMSWQLSEESPEWEDDTDRLLLMLPIAGSVFRKWWFDPELGRNRSEVISAEDFVVNQGCKSMARTPRCSFKFTRYPYEIEEKQRSGEWLDVEIDEETGIDEDGPIDFIEHYCRIDLDDDDYAEPYVVTVHVNTQQVVRIDPCFRPEKIRLKEKKIISIEAETYFAHYQFMPDPDGGFYGMGLGQLLYGTNKAINGVINMLMDAGHMSTLGGGFLGKGASIQGGTLQFKPGEWKKVDVIGGVLAQNIVALPTKEPSPTLFSLLGMLVDSGKSLAATKDILTGENTNSQMPASLGLALIEQGLKVFSAIYKRVHRALHDELKILYRLNQIYTNPQTYFTFLDSKEQVSPEDYSATDMNVVPVTDPTVVTDMQKLGRAQFLMQFIGNTSMNPKEIMVRVLEAANIEDIPQLFAEQPPIDPKVKEAEVKANHEAMRIKIDGYKALAQILKDETQAIKNIADAEAAEVGQQLAQYQAMFAGMRQQVEQQTGIGDGQDTAGAGPGMAQGAGDGSPMGSHQGPNPEQGGPVDIGNGNPPGGTGSGGGVQGPVGAAL